MHRLCAFLFLVLADALSLRPAVRVRQQPLVLADALSLRPAVRVRQQPRISMMADGWRPKTVDPLGQAMGVPRAVDRNYEFWLDLRDAENTFAQMVVLKLFYAVRRVVDEAGKALPQGAGVQGLLFDESRYDRADTIGQDLPIILATATGFANATAAGQLDPLPAEVRAPRDLEALCTAKESLEAVDGTAAIALPPDDAMLWAVALTGLEECELEALESNLGA